MDKKLEKADKILENITLIFFAVVFFRYLPAMLAFIAFAIPYTLLVYGLLFLLYTIPHFFRDLSSDYIAEDMAEQRLDEEEVVFERSDLAIIEFWEYNVH